jgi:imidazoleglycerol-phosphate dehydratase/histidinol-phosphatase
VQKKYLFIDRDNTMVVEPPVDKQLDSIEKLEFLPGVFEGLHQLIKAGYHLVMVSNQDGLGTDSFPQADFDAPHDLMMKIFTSQGITFDEVLLCEHFQEDGCDCRKPKTGLVHHYLKDQSIERKNSFVIGDRETDMGLAENMGIEGIQYGVEGFEDWYKVSQYILNRPRTAAVSRQTKETNIDLKINLDDASKKSIDTGIEFLDHMLDQISVHGAMSIELKVVGDLGVDDHHTVEDIGIVLGNAIRDALGDKLGIGRYGFACPLDEAATQVLIDFSNRPAFVYKGQFKTEKLGELGTQMIPHFFQSMSDGLRAAVHVDIKGENDHHMAESAFKAFGRALKQAKAKTSEGLPSSKGVL